MIFAILFLFQEPWDEYNLVLHKQYQGQYILLDILSNCPILTSVYLRSENETCKEFSDEKITMFLCDAIINGLKPVLFRYTKIESFTLRIRFPSRWLSKNSAARL